MKREAPLDVLISLAQDRLDEAGRELAALTQQRSEADAQLNALDTYRIDYTLRLQQTTENGLSASNYRNFRQFIATLDEAISQQNKLIMQIDSRLEAGRRLWHNEKRRLGSYEILKARQLNQEKHREQRREQQAADEASAGLHRRHTHSH